MVCFGFQKRFEDLVYLYFAFIFIEDRLFPHRWASSIRFAFFLFLCEHQAKSYAFIKHFLPTRHCARYCNPTISRQVISSTVNHRGFGTKLFHVVSLFSLSPFPEVTAEVPRAIVLLPGYCIWREKRTRLKELSCSPAFFRGESKVYFITVWQFVNL